MSDRVSKLIASLAPSGIREFFELVLGMPDVLSLGVGEPDFSTPWHISEKAIYGLERGYTSYTSNKGMIELRRAITTKISRDFGIEYDPHSQVLITVGVSEAMDLAMRAILNPGERVLIIRPCYVSYEPLVRMAGGEPVFLDLASDTDFKATPEMIEDILKSNSPVKAVIFNYPSNPTGVSYLKAELEEIARLFNDFGVLVISDEIYDELTYDFSHTPYLALENSKPDNLIYLNGFSKAYAMTGWRIGYAIGPSDIIGVMTKIHQYSILCAPIMSQMAALEAVENSGPDVSSMRKEYKRRRNFIVAELNRLGLKTRLPEGAFYTYTDISSSGMDSMSFARSLLEKEKVAVVPGTAFSPNGSRYIRISYSSSMEKLRQAVMRIEAFLTDLR